MDIEKTVNQATEYLKEKGFAKAKVGIILGTGLNDFAVEIENAISVPYGEIPGFQETKVEGHRGEIIYGTVEGVQVIALAGRFHYYEGFTMQEITLPTRVMIKLGIERLIISNAAGCINTDWQACDLMLISDHINLSGDNPLRGENLDAFGPRFPDMTDTYDATLRKEMLQTAAEQGITLREGIYAMMAGPSFETPAEIRFLKTIGADAVGMSSVPEAIVANHAGLEIIGISFLSNMAAGISKGKLSLQEINENKDKVSKDFAKLAKIAITI